MTATWFVWAQNKYARLKAQTSTEFYTVNRRIHDIWLRHYRRVRRSHAVTGRAVISAGDVPGDEGIIFKGITEAFLASAQFNDLLAPLPQVNRDFWRRQSPGSDVEPRRISAAVQERRRIDTAEPIAPLLAELQKLGINIKAAL